MPRRLSSSELKGALARAKAGAVRRPSRSQKVNADPLRIAVAKAAQWEALAARAVESCLADMEKMRERHTAEIARKDEIITQLRHELAEGKAEASRRRGPSAAEIHKAYRELDASRSEKEKEKEFARRFRRSERAVRRRLLEFDEQLIRAMGLDRNAAELSNQGPKVAPSKLLEELLDILSGLKAGDSDWAACAAGTAGFLGRVPRFAARISAGVTFPCPGVVRFRDNFPV
ncbi:MAG TPA: hypothetical protein VMK12_16580, partial [Anaeromyxobacteraceae bacterium]|nr:hypothetical protein [Anaeromyxobacteraceae bacterium]